MGWNHQLAHTSLQEVSNGRTHGFSRTLKKTFEYRIIALSIAPYFLRGPLGFGPIQFLMDSQKMWVLNQK